MQLNAHVFRPTVEGLDALEDTFMSTLRARFGFIDESFIAHRLNVAFKASCRTTPGWVNFSEFFTTAARLGLVAPAQQNKVEALFDRYDTDGEGKLRYEFFTATLVGLQPNPNVNAAVRAAINSYRKAASRAGLATLLELKESLATAAKQLQLGSGGGGGRGGGRGGGASWYTAHKSEDGSSKSGIICSTPNLTRREAARVLSMIVPDASRADIHTLLVEASRPHENSLNGGKGGGGGEPFTVNAKEIVDNLLRASLTRRKRAALNSAWASLVSSSSGPGGVVPSSAIAAGLGGGAASSAVLKYLAATAGTSGTSSAGGGGITNEKAFVDFFRYILPLLPAPVNTDEAAFESFLEDAFGVAGESGGSAFEQESGSRASSSSSSTYYRGGGGGGAGGGAFAGRTMHIGAGVGNNSSAGSTFGGNVAVSTSRGGMGGGGVGIGFGIRGVGGGGGAGGGGGNRMEINNQYNNNNNISAAATVTSRAPFGLQQQQHQQHQHHLRPLPGSPQAVFKGVHSGEIPPEPCATDAGGVVGVCMNNTLGRGVEPTGREEILGRPQRVSNFGRPAPFGGGAVIGLGIPVRLAHAQATASAMSSSVATTASTRLFGTALGSSIVQPDVVVQPVGTMMLRGVAPARDVQAAGTNAAAEYFKYMHANKGVPVWRHNKPSSLIRSEN